MALGLFPGMAVPFGPVRSFTREIAEVIGDQIESARCEVSVLPAQDA
ncbi:hypothetical protein LWC34_04550 [Kibdelosporangium philippinense]|uniref:Uncharacterized protein n=1 Tax=Kibdelosporangium philippinense TaxID=211113 RepID=A0ABS8Z4Z2_9PSEU|nr:hypothetical protein [Kibdelosporangium philippinense]MCE7002098.1 hypothetical protein [Kibdelosporangium philippinense]